VIFIGIPLHVEQYNCSKRKQPHHNGDGEVAMVVPCFTALLCLVFILVCGVV
jgi:hypothetical protein